MTLFEKQTLHEMVRKIVQLTFLLLAYCSITSEKELYEISPIGMICEVLDPTIVSSFTCKSKNVNRTFNMGTKEIIYQPDIILTNYHGKVQLYRKFATVYRPFLITLDIDWCAFVKDENSPLGLALNIKDRRNYGNFYDPCPISGRRYEQLPFMYESLPDLLPDGEYRFDMTFYTFIDNKKRNILRSRAMGVVKPKKAEQWRK